MSELVVASGTCMCTMGTAPAPLKVTSQAKVLAGGKPCGTISDFAALANVGPFGMCTSLANPQVAAATAAAVGILRRLNLRNNAVVTAAGVAAGVCNEVRERHAAENAISAHKNDLQKRCRERALPFTTSYAFFVKV